MTLPVAAYLLKRSLGIAIVKREDYWPRQYPKETVAVGKLDEDGNLKKSVVLLGQDQQDPMCLTALSLQTGEMLSIQLKLTRKGLRRATRFSIDDAISSNASGRQDHSSPGSTGDPGARHNYAESFAPTSEQIQEVLTFDDTFGITWRIVVQGDLEDDDELPVFEADNESDDEFLEYGNQFEDDDAPQEYEDEDDDEEDYEHDRAPEDRVYDCRTYVEASSNIQHPALQQKWTLRLDGGSSKPSLCIAHRHYLTVVSRALQRISFVALPTPPYFASLLSPRDSFWDMDPEDGHAPVDYPGLCVKHFNFDLFYEDYVERRDGEAAARYRSSGCKYNCTRLTDKSRELIRNSTGVDWDLSVLIKLVVLDVGDDYQGNFDQRTYELNKFILWLNPFAAAGQGDFRVLQAKELGRRRMPHALDADGALLCEGPIVTHDCPKECSKTVDHYGRRITGHYRADGRSLEHLEGQMWTVTNDWHA